MHDVATFLAQHEPFRDLAQAELDAIASQVEIEYFAAGQMILEQGAAPVQRVGMVRVGTVELVDRGQVLDLLGEGELFGHPSMLAGSPTGFAVRAQDDALCYRLPPDQLLPLLTRPAGLRFVARTLLSRPLRRDEPRPADGLAASRTMAASMREAVVRCRPGTAIQEVARRMADEGASCAVVELGGGRLGIVTDRDLRVRVVAAGTPLDAAVEGVMTAPAFTAQATELATDVMVDMLNRGIRHVPVVSARREVLGVVTDVDLLAADTRTPFVVRRQIARAGDLEALVAVAQDLRPTIIALHDARVAPVQLGAIIAAFADALTRRALQLMAHQTARLPALAWYATGSMGRREAFPSSDIDSALVIAHDAEEARVGEVAEAVLGVLERCGFARDPHGATAGTSLFMRSADDWRSAVQRWLDRPEDPRLLIVLSVLADRHRVHETGAVEEAFGDLGEARHHPLFLGQMRRLALVHRPPTGFLRDIVLEHTGERRRRFDVKRGGFLPIVDLARYLGLAAGLEVTSTPDRLHAAAENGLLTHQDATSLLEAFELLVELRMDHQVEQLRQGQVPDDVLDPAQLNPLVRRYLREAFRAIVRVQRGLPSLTGA